MTKASQTESRKEIQQSLSIAKSLEDCKTAK